MILLDYLMVSSRVKIPLTGHDPPSKFVFLHMVFSLHGVIQISNAHDTLPWYHMKYPPQQLYKFPAQGYVAIVSVLF